MKMDEATRAKVREDIYMEVDGFYVYWQKPNCGWLDAEMLRVIADYLDELNAPWQESIDRYFDANKDKEND